MLAFVDCYLIIGSKVSDSAGNRCSISRYWHDEALGEIGVVRLRVIFSLDADQIHDIDQSVLFGAIDAKVGINTRGQFVDPDIFPVGDEPNVVVFGQAFHYCG